MKPFRFLRRFVVFALLAVLSTSIPTAVPLAQANELAPPSGGVVHPSMASQANPLPQYEPPPDPHLPTLSLDVVAAPTTVTVGMTMTVQLIARNAGAHPADLLEVALMLPPDVQLIDVTKSSSPVIHALPPITMAPSAPLTIAPQAASDTIAAPTPGGDLAPDESGVVPATNVAAEGVPSSFIDPASWPDMAVQIAPTVPLARGNPFGATRFTKPAFKDLVSLRGIIAITSV